MLKLAAVLYAVAGTTMAGILMIVALVMGYDDARGIITAVAVGFVLGLPVAWFVASKINPEGQ